MEIEKLLTSPVFRNFPEERLTEFLRSAPAVLRVYSPNDFVALQNSLCHSLYLLYEGKVRTHMVNGEGKQVTIEDIEAPRLLAPAVIFATDNRFPVNILTVTPCEVLIINKEEFVGLMQKEPVVMQNFLRIISDRSIFLSRKLNSFALRNLKGRLAAYLLEREGQHSQQEIADVLGVARPSLARVLAELIEEGGIKMDKRTIRIVDRELLTRYR